MDSNLDFLIDAISNKLMPVIHQMNNFLERNERQLRNRKNSPEVTALYAMGRRVLEEECKANSDLFYEILGYMRHELKTVEQNGNFRLSQVQNNQLRYVLEKAQKPLFPVLAKFAGPVVTLDNEMPPYAQPYDC